MLVTKQLTIAIEFHSIENNKDIIKISSFVCNRRKTTTWGWVNEFSLFFHTTPLNTSKTYNPSFSKVKQVEIEI